MKTKSLKIKAQQDVIRELYREIETLRNASEKARRVLSHLIDAPKADPLKYVPTVAVREAYQALKTALD